MWKLIAWLVSRESIANYLIKRAQRTPYFHLEGYMNRWWVFNPYSSDSSLTDEERHTSVRWSWLPSIRVHHILREDRGRDLHDHPWNARTIILKGDYTEIRLFADLSVEDQWVNVTTRNPGDTATLKFGEYHTIHSVSAGGVWTLFFTWKYQGTWGFWVNGKKVSHKDYINEGGTMSDVFNKGREEYPMADGLLYYFPAALAAVAHVSKKGNDQHNPGQPLHWSRWKSTDHANKILRHQVEAGTMDKDGTRHSAKVAWRALAQLQEELEREEGAPLPRSARLKEEEHKKNVGQISTNPVSTSYSEEQVFPVEGRSWAARDLGRDSGPLSYPCSTAEAGGGYCVTLRD